MQSLKRKGPVPASENIHHVFLMCHKRGSGSPGSAPGGTAGEGGRTIAPNEPGALAECLKRAGYRVTRSTSPLDSKRLLEKVRPSILVLEPLVCSASGVELEIASELQQTEDPIPLLLLIHGLEELEEIRRVPGLFKDFLTIPFTHEELLHRLELLLQSKEQFLLLQSHARHLEGQIIRDFKTSLYSERHFRDLLRQEFHRSERHRTPLSFLLIDIDNFKSINDTFEYVFGDHVLIQFAEILKRNVRDIDHPGRFGGDEFMVLLPNTNQAEAVQVANRIRNQVEAKDFDNGRYFTRVTVSIGIDTFSGRGVSSPDELRRRANLALKEAKRRGKNKIWLYSGSGTPETEGGEPRKRAGREEGTP